MATSGLVWTVEPITLGVNAKAWGDKVLAGLMDLADAFAAKLEAMAKQNAPWTDRTGGARQGLRGFAQKAATAITIYLVHSVDYGIYLEMGTRKMAPRAIIVPTLEAHYGELAAALRALLA